MVVLSTRLQEEHLRSQEWILFMQLFLALVQVNYCQEIRLGVLPAGPFSFIVVDDNGCVSDSVKLTINEPTALTANNTIDSLVSCNGFTDGGVTTNATGGTSPYTYAWSNAATSASITGVVAGTYTVTVTDNNGCTATAASTITEPVVLIASTALDSNASCAGQLDGGATASATGGNNALYLSME